MRNLKRVLSLALAVVMVIGMMVMTTGAADIADIDEVKNVEAVSVMNALEVLEGDENGVYNPAGILTREQAAKIICVMLMGKENADMLVGTSSFTDVAADRWSAGYISYCSSLDIISGYDGKFDPTGELTGVAFAKMLLVALGYDAAIEGYVNNTNWATNIGKDAIEAGINVKGVSLDAPVSRDNAAQMAFNTLTANMVRYDDKGTNITMSDGTSIIVGASSPENYGVGKDYTVATTTDGKEGIAQFCEVYFEDLLKDGGEEDDFSRPSAKGWFISKDGDRVCDPRERVYNEVETAAATVRPSMRTGTKLADMMDKLDLEPADNVTITDAQAGTSTTVAKNNAAITDTTYAATNHVEFFTDMDGKVCEVVFYEYTLIQITKVTELTAAQIKNLSGKDKGSTVKVDFSIAGGATVTGMYDSRFEGFDYAEKDFVMVVLKDGNAEIWDSYLADTVEGEVTAIKQDDPNEYKVAGEYYPIATAKIGTVATPSIGDEGKWVVDDEGCLAATIDTSAKSDNYAYVYRIVYKDTGVDADGYDTASATAYVVLADGTKASYPVSLAMPAKKFVKGDAEGAIFGDITSAAKNGGNTVKAVVPYEIVNGKFEIATAADFVMTSTDTVKKDDAKITNGDNAYFCNSDTVFIFAKENDGKTKMEVTTATGYKNVELTGVEMQFVADKYKNVKYVFVAVEDDYSAETGMTVAVLMDNVVVKSGTGKTPADPVKYTYSIAVDAEKVDLVLNGDNHDIFAAEGLAKGDVFGYKYNNDGSVTIEKYAAQTVTYVNGTQVELSTSGTVDLTGAEFYTIAYRTQGVTEGGTLTAKPAVDGNKVVIVNCDTDPAIEYVYVVNTVNPEA